MKRSLLFFITLLMFNQVIIAQTFKGKLTYTIKAEGDNAAMMAAFMPDSNNYYLSGSNLLFKMNGGMTGPMLGEFLTLGKKGESYMIKHDEKIAYKMSTTESQMSKSQIQKLDESIIILGHTCQKYKVISSENGEEKVLYMWVTNDIKTKRPRYIVQNGGYLFTEGIEGMPLKIMTTTGGTTVITTCISINKTKLSSNLFKIPKDYQIKDFDPDMFGGK